MREWMIILAVVCACGCFCASHIPPADTNPNLSAPPMPDSTVSPVFENCPRYKCSCECSDPFDPRVSPAQGYFAGLCLNTCDQRSVLPLDTATVSQHGYYNVSDASGTPVYAVNIAHAEHDSAPLFFCAGRLPLEGLKDVILQIEHAGGLQAHAQLRFSFDAAHPVLLTSQNTAAFREVFSVTDLTFSVEALAPPGVGYKGDWGFKSEYFQSYRLTSQIIRARKMIKEDHHPVWQYRIKLTAGEKQAILKSVLEHSRTSAYATRYHTINNNCILEIYTCLDAAIEYNFFQRARMKLHSRSQFLPTKAPRHLAYRGLASRDSKEFHLPNLEEELGWTAWVRPVDAQ